MRLASHPLGDDLPALSAAVSKLLGQPATVLSVTGGGPDAGKAHGMTNSVQVTVDCGGVVRKGFLKTPCEDLYGETLAADAMRELTWRLDGYRWFAGHVRCAAAGVATAGNLVRAGPVTGQPWLLEWAVPGVRYADRLAELPAAGPSQAAAEARQLCAAMVAFHRPVEGDAAALYRRALRDALIVPVHRLVDSADAFWACRGELRAEVEHACARWRLLLADRHDRLRYVHHDFHPWNIFFDPSAGTVATIGARLPGIGDPYDDVAAFAVNYLWFGHARHGRVEGAYLAGFTSFRRAYLTSGSADTEPAVMAPFLAKRLLVLLNPAYYPAMPPATRGWLESLLQRCLRDEIDLLRGDVGHDLAAGKGAARP